MRGKAEAEAVPHDLKDILDQLEELASLVDIHFVVDHSKLSQIDKNSSNKRIGKRSAALSVEPMQAQVG